MNVKFKDIKYFLVFVIVFSLAVQAHRMLLKPENTKINTEEIEKTLALMENEAEELLLSAVNLIKNDGFEFITTDSIMLPKQGIELPESNHSLVIYKNDKLKYWSDNTVQVPHKYKNEIFTAFKVAKISNAWYEPITKQYKD